MGMAKGVLAITPDRELGKTLRVALTAAGAETMTVISASEIPRGPIDAALVVLHQPDDIGEGVARVASRLANGAQMIVILPRGDLAATVAALQSHEKVAGVLNADNIRTQEVTAMATRLLFGDIFGLEKVLPWGAHIHSIEVGDYQEKSAAIERVSRFAASIGVRRKYRESIEQCCDEMLMNALYDAPVDASGKPLEPGKAGKKRAALTGDDRALIEYGCDGQRFAVAVRDRFGRFERSVLVRYLDKCLHSAEQIDKKVGGAGLGLYLMSHSATSLMFNVLPGVATECVCTFDIGATKVRLEQLAVFNELPAGGASRHAARESLRARGTIPNPPLPGEAKVATGTAEQEAAPAEPTGLGRGLTIALTLAVLLLVGAVAVVGAPRFFGWKSGDASAAQPTAPAPVAPAAASPEPQGTLTVRSNVSGKITVEGVAECTGRTLPLLRCPLPSGTHHVFLYGEDPRLSFSFSVVMDGTSIERHLAFGVVESRSGHGLATSATEPPFPRLALPAGTHEVYVADETSGKRRPRNIPVHAGQTVIVP
ncbi:MAG TPA: hypothetical protein VFU21_18840 [Kofleriaceae bacterium]|nr:hypothetical protein [Kofleriaceae bacterium]